MKSKLVAISAISAAFASVFLIIGIYIPVIDVVMSLVASAFITLPLAAKSVKGSLLSFFVSIVISFFAGGTVASLYNLVFPSYVLFFGIYAVIDYAVTEKGKMPERVWYAVKLIWAVVAAYLLIVYYTLILGIPLDYTFSIFGKNYDFSNINGIFYIFLAVYGAAAVLVSALYFRAIKVFTDTAKRVFKINNK